jgi:CrcB protein
MIAKIALIGVFGALGSLSRYWVSGLSHRLLGPDFAYGTLAVNVLGSFMFGLVWTLADERGAISPLARTALLVGFMGAFTTFSTFAFETMGFLRDSQYLMAFANIASNCLLGVGAVILGMWLVRG